MCSSTTKWGPAAGARNLYEKTGLPDNVSPSPGDRALERNKHISVYPLHICIANASQVALQLCSVILFWSTYECLAQKCLSQLAFSPIHLLLTLTTVSVLVYVLTIGRSLSIKDLISHLKRSVHFGLFGLGLSPILSKLTSSISTDTIHTMSFFALLLHLLSHNYHRETFWYSSTALSFNAALFAAVCLASRLDSSFEAFVLLSTSVLCFILFPLWRSQLIESSFMWPLTLLVFMTTVGLSWPVLGLSASLSTVATLVIVAIGAPWLFVKCQSFKDTKHGPWDEAVPKIK